MSMFDDILWKTDDENCVSNAEKVQNYAKRFSPGHWTFLGPGSEERYGDSPPQKGQWDHTANKMIQKFKEAGQDEKKERVQIPLKNWVAFMTEPAEIDMLVSFLSRPAPGNRMRENTSTTVLEKKVQMTQLCEKALFQHPVIAGNRYKVRLEDDDGWRTITPPCREYSNYLSYPKIRVLAVILAGTIIGPVQEVRIVKIHDGYSIEVAIVSICEPEDTSYVVISRETERFVNEIHDHIAEVRSSNELLEDLHE